MSQNIYAFNRGLSEDDEAATRRQESVDAAWRALSSGHTGLKNFPTFILDCLEGKVWEKPRNLNPGIVEPMPFDEFVRQPYPRGLDTTIEVIEAILTSSPVKGEAEKALTLLTTVTKRGPGGANNPHGRAGKPAEEINVDNVNVDTGARPTGNSAEAGLRRLAKEAEAGDEKAADNLRQVHEGRKSVNAACVEMGWRPAKIDREVRDRAAQSLAERIVANFPPDEIDAAKADAFACGAKALGVALTNLVGGSIMDKRGWR